MWIKSFAKSILPERLWNILGKLRLDSKVMLFYLFRIFKIKGNKIVLSNFYGKGFGDNPKYIALELLKQNKGYDLVWLVKDLNDKSFPDGIRLVKANSVKAVYEEVTARVWVDNCRKYGWARKRKGQFYVQTWHGALGPKKCEKDSEAALNPEYLKMAKNDSKMIDLCISNGKHITNFFGKSFWYSGKILESGCPRNDILINIAEQEKTEIKEKINIKNKICLYAPTFRNDYAAKYNDLDYAKLKKELERKFGGDFSIILRLHPNLASQTLDENLPAYVINLTYYPDMQELLAVSDVVITDYSSCVYDFGFTRRPAFIFAPDLEEYKRTNRDLYFDLEDTPFKLAQTNDELMENIEEYSEYEYKVALGKFYGFHGVFENGDASRKVADVIKDICGVKVL